MIYDPPLVARNFLILLYAKALLITELFAPTAVAATAVVGYYIGMVFPEFPPPPPYDVMIIYINFWCCSYGLNDELVEKFKSLF